MNLEPPRELALALIPLFAWCDRDVGDGREGGLSRSLAMALAIVGGGVLGFLTLGKGFLAVGALWAALRSIGFKNGTLNPETPGKIAAVALRYALWIPVGALLAHWSGGDALKAACLMGLAAVGSTAMRAWFGQKTKAGEGGEFNAVVERVTGALFGAALAAYALT